LAGRTDDRALAERLRAGAARSLERLREIDPATGLPYDPNYASRVTHIRFPSIQLVLGRVGEYAAQYAASGMRSLETDFDVSGARRYAPASGGPDFAKTHFADHANGYGATALFPALEAAWLSGDPELTRRALELLDKQTVLYANSEPRGAQTWEIPLHTPDIVAAAYMVKSYSLGYAITGRAEYLEQARYWAWTGVPFVYLYPPGKGRVGVYASIAVYGASNRELPVWIGQPVQWCGLVYASALHMLGGFDPKGPWLRIAKGITEAGLRMIFPASAAGYAGLLPDGYDIKTQTWRGPEINPGAVQAHLAELYGEGQMYGFTRLPESGWQVSAPCKILKAEEGKGYARLNLDGWPGGSYSVLLSRVNERPGVVETRAGGGNGAAQFSYDAAGKLLIVGGLNGAAEITIHAGSKR
ncbi:MAG: hypothetical protein WCX65_20075, partial [bacterium]